MSGPPHDEGRPPARMAPSDRLTDTDMVQAEQAVLTELEHVLCRAKLRLNAESLDGAWDGLLSAVLRNHADLLEIAEREGWIA